MWEAIVWFFPAAVANASPVLANKLPFINRWSTPIDLGLKFRGRRLLGNHKTWRGLTTGVVAGALAGWLMVEAGFGDGRLGIGPQLAAFMGFGALAGDSLESFFKRLRGIESGRSWFPFDQTDYIIGGLAAAAPFSDIKPGDFLAILVFYFGVHLLASYIGYLAGLKRRPI